MRIHRFVLAIALVCAQVSWAQVNSGAQDSPQSPRAALRQFLQYASRGDYVAAAQYLALDARDAPRRADIARRVYEVIRRRVVIDLDSVSPLPQGDTADAEPPLQDRVGIMYARGGDTTRPLALVRTMQGGQQRWVISAASVAALDAAYTSVARSWTTGRLPDELIEPGPFGVPRWKWIGGIFGVPLAWVVALVLGAMLRHTALAIARRTKATWDDELIVRLRGPVRLFLFSILAVPVLILLELEANTTATVWRILRGITIVAVFWMLLRMIGMAQDHLARMAWASDRTNAQTIVPLIGRSLRLALGLVALLVVFSELGYPVATLLAGLGIGGIVVALAAQKTVENLFGSVSLAADRVLRVGDWVKFEDVQGTVERIGLRSTHVRTLDRTVVKVPNGRLADLRIESFGERDRIRFFTTIRLVYDSTATQVRTVIGEIEALLTSHPRTWREGITVRLVTLGDYSFDINVNAWFATTNFAEFEVIRQDVLLAIMEIVERAGTRLAVPLQALHIERDKNASNGPVAVRGDHMASQAGDPGTTSNVADRSPTGA
ncbi:MAG TPA: mechanosensitive ion channel family protein [Gemmatimonadaceae bacterium]|nr:mechanosensitive ion channel family protein [Gemmatimonadaceae bacterium]